MKINESKQIAVLYRQVQFVKTRLDAYEKVLGKTGSIFKAILNRNWFIKEVDRVQGEMFKEHDKMVDENIKKNREELSKPKLTIIGSNGLSKIVAIIAIAILSSGCVTKKTYSKGIKDSYQDGYKKADKECLELQKKYVSYIESLKDRLKRFNQIDENGELRKLKKFDGDVSGDGWDNPKGNETWMK